MRPLIEFAFRLRRLLIGRLGIRTLGVKVMVFNDREELLLVRHRYANRDQFLLPGGGIGRRESPEAAAKREIEEEVGLRVTGVARVSEHFSASEGKRDTIHLCRAEAEGEPTPDGIEIVEARFFPLRDLPGNVSPATRRRIAELRGERRADGSW